MIFPFLLVLAYAHYARQSTAFPTSNFLNITSTNSSTSLTAYSNSTFIALADTSAACNDLRTCRSLSNIVWSCLVTIFACIWTAVHRNIPGPDQSWLGRICEKAKVVVVTLLAPEWVLAWAVRQFLLSWQLAERLERHRSKARAKKAWKLKMRKLELLLSTAFDQQNEEGIPASGTSVEGELHTDETSALSSADSDDEETDTDATKSMLEADLQKTQVALKCERQWTITHGFFINMGGFHYYRDGKPIRPLDGAEVKELFMAGGLIPPTKSEIEALGQGDVLSKAITVIQTLWFILQCIARRVDGLPITQLEVVTLAYTTITVAMYGFWWHKPLNVACPIRVVAKPGLSLINVEHDVLGEFIQYVVLGYDHSKDLEIGRVPTFHGGSGFGFRLWDLDCVEIADIVALFAATVFGGIHMVAWSYAFPSSTETFIWRFSATTIVAIPFFLALMLMMGVVTSTNENFMLGCLTFFMYAFCLPVCFLYITARLLLLITSFTTLQSLPPEAYQTVQWTLFIPHIF
ncbi:hypothetical protein HYDPIDRAFT_133946 [Hydnomerulius pinastri MD-312]|uniref:Transmembrane protein n=1 Tax=Hydnomerulius pinastri MD-312 TaxID=994086 RepID=A0A0C9VYS4_9AGAM|nr:hypothetical protein HYDPIDRAFT_133946 [Hydnomerulius pinastri MD-312]